MNQPMAWADDLLWVEIPVNADGGEDYMGSPSTLRAYVGWDLHLDPATPLATPVSVTLRNTDGAPVTPAQWRRVKTSEIIAASRTFLTLVGEIGQVIGDAREASRAILRALGDVSEPEPRRYGSDHYRRIADLYNTEVASANPQPVQTILRELHKTIPGLKETTLRGWLRTAKARGHITKATRARKPRQ